MGDLAPVSSRIRLLFPDCPGKSKIFGSLNLWRFFRLLKRYYFRLPKSLAVNHRFLFTTATFLDFCFCFSKCSNRLSWKNKSLFFQIRLVITSLIKISGVLILLIISKYIDRRTDYVSKFSFI